MDSICKRGDVFLPNQKIKKSLEKSARILKEKIGICMILGILVAVIAACHMAGESLQERMQKREVVSQDIKTMTEEKSQKQKKVVIDAGHGGEDPGKIGVNGEKEKEINLQVALKLKEVLEEEGITVVLTRDSGKRLVGSQRGDLQARVEVINGAKPDLAVSIHQNSYTQESIRGAQVFYFTHSEKAKEAAEMIQQELKKMDEKYAREKKENTTYYMLKNTKYPTVIVECGFLSNYEESKLLLEEEYQRKLAETIGSGILKYVESQ